MKRAFIGLLSLATVVALTGCTLFPAGFGGPDEGLEPNSSLSGGPTESSSTSEPSASPPVTSVTPSASPSPSAIFETLQLRFDVVDASGGTLLVVAEITNFAADGGTCTLSYYQGEQATVLATTRSERNINGTQCSPFNVGLSGVPKGAQQLTISYQSTAHIGESAKFEVIIP